MIEVTSPDGRLVSFPDGTPHAEIERAMAAKFGGPKPEKNWVERRVEGLRDMWTGDKTREYEFPELPSEFVPGVGVSSNRLAFGRDDSRKLGIATEIFGDKLTNRGFDRFGNAWVEKGGNKYYLNRPGASRQDLDDIMTTGLLEAWTARAGGKLGAGAGGTLGRVVGTGAGAAGGSVGQDVIAQQAGATEGPDPMAATMAFAFGSGMEALAPLVGPWIRRHWRRGDILDADGNLTKQGRKALTRMGLDPDAVKREASERFEALARESADPQTLAGNLRLAEADSLGVRLSKGDITGDIVDQSFEDAALKAARGEKAAGVMRGFRAGQAEDLAAARSRVGVQAAGGNVDEVGNGMAGAQERLVARKAAEKAASKKLFDQAKNGRSYMRREAISDLATDMRREIGQEFGETMTEFAPLMSTLKKLDGWAGKKQIKGISVKEMFGVRRQINANISKLADKPQDAALIQAKKILDSHLDDAARNAMLFGDDDALRQFKAANLGWREWNKRWTGNRIFEDITKTADGAPVFDARDAANKLIGQAGVGNNVGATQALKKIKAVADDETMSGLRQEAFLRLFKNAPDGVKGFTKTFDDAMKKNPEFMREMFGGELASIKKLRRVVGYAQERAPGINYSSSGHEVARAIREMGWLGKGFGAFVNRFMTPFREASDAIAATAATAPKKLRPPVGGVGLLGGTGGVAGQVYSDGQ